MYLLIHLAEHWKLHPRTSYLYPIIEFFLLVEMIVLTLIYCNCVSNVSSNSLSCDSVDLINLLPESMIKMIIMINWHPFDLSWLMQMAELWQLQTTDFKLYPGLENFLLVKKLQLIYFLIRIIVLKNHSSFSFLRNILNLYNLRSICHKNEFLVYIE